jgi:hypothetical protein
MQYYNITLEYFSHDDVYYYDYDYDVFSKSFLFP